MSRLLDRERKARTLVVEDHGRDAEEGLGAEEALSSPLTKSCGSDSVALLAWGRISDGDGTIGGCSG